MLQETTPHQRTAGRTGRGRDAHWRLDTPAPGDLCVVFLRPVLRYEHVRLLFDWLLNERRLVWQNLTFDFSNVRDLGAPWAPLFAHLAYVALRTGAECQVVGLSARLARMAGFAMRGVAPGNLRMDSEEALVASRDVCSGYLVE